MTVEERVSDVMRRLTEFQHRGTRPFDWNKKTRRFVEWSDDDIRRFVITQIVMAARLDAIEECAEIARWQSLPLEPEGQKSDKAIAHEKCAKIIEERIRALAAPKEEAPGGLHHQI